MPRMTREEEETFVAQVEADLDDPDAWGEPLQGAPPSSDSGRCCRYASTPTCTRR